VASKVNLKPLERPPDKVNFPASAPDKVTFKVLLLSSVVISITLAVFSGVEKLAFVVIENANAWNPDFFGNNNIRITEKTITVTVTDLDDEAPTNIQIRNINTNLIVGSLADTFVGTLSAIDVDTDDDALTFTTNSADFEIVNGNELKTKHALTTAGNKSVTITAVILMLLFPKKSGTIALTLTL
jgi:hypothetical protein